MDICLAKGARSRSIPVLHVLHEDGTSVVHSQGTGLVEHQAPSGSANDLGLSSTHVGVQEQGEAPVRPGVAHVEPESRQVEGSCAVGGIGLVPSECLALDHAEEVA
ncbi:hypothetical protein V6N12_010858 [Hibiscus sabdariffa]|uniref:Uncharacterized protein n=1 Tax=Hibiscus sabdariffa TaxID=183260 RepID=A0ABR2EMZ5_9ROSI